MGRNDSLLNTGMTSQSIAKKKAQSEEKAAKRVVLMPAGEIIQAQFEVEINKLLFGPYPDEDKMTDLQFRVERRARRIAIKNLLAIQTRLSIILRDHKPKGKEEDVGERWKAATAG